MANSALQPTSKAPKEPLVWTPLPRETQLPVLGKTLPEIEHCVSDLQFWASAVHTDSGSEAWYSPPVGVD